MRVAAVEIRSHPGLGDLDVDLRGTNGRAAKLVVLAGENGCGKTALLEAVFTALAPSNLLGTNPRRLAPGHYRVLLEPDMPNTSGTFNGMTTTPNAPELLGEIRKHWPGFDGVVVDIDGAAVRKSNPYHKYYRLSDNSSITVQQDAAEVLGGSYNCFYSEANVSFEVPPIQTIRTSAGEGQDPSTPLQAAFPVRSGPSLAVEVAQLLVDLQAADDAEVARWLDRNEGRPPETVRKRRINRFTEAFARINPHKCFRGIETANGEHRAMFEENGFHTSLADLSTGEKQIVFRGAFLLRQADNLPGAVVLIDEPELSLHPNWQSNILPFYEQIVGEVPEKTNQIIVATQSPFVVHGSPTAKHVVLRRNRQTGKVEVDRDPSYPGVTPADVAVAAFDLSGFVHDARGQRLALIVEGPTDRAILQEAWRKLRGPQVMPFMIRSADGANNIPRLLGVTGGKSGPLLDALADSGTVIVGLFDFDQQGYGQWNGTIGLADAEAVVSIATECIVRKRRDVPIWAALLPVPDFRKSYAGSQLGADSQLTIELLFPDSYVGTLLERVPVAGDGNVTRLAARSDAQKKAVALKVAEFPPETFNGFSPIFELLDQIADRA